MLHFLEMQGNIPKQMPKKQENLRVSCSGGWCHNQDYALNPNFNGNSVF